MANANSGDHSQSITVSQTENIEIYFNSKDIIPKFQEMAMLFDKAIDIIDGPFGMLNTTKQIKLGDRMAGNNGVIDLKAFLEVLKGIYSDLNKGIKYVSRMNELKRRIEKMIKKQVWKSKLNELPPDEFNLSTILLKKLKQYGAIYGTGVLVGGATAGFTIGAALACLFSLAIACLNSICCLFSGVFALTVVGVGVGTGIGLLGVWVYNAYRIGEKRNESFLAFRDLQRHIDETNLRYELRNLVQTLKNYCEGIIGVARLGSSLDGLSPDTTIGSIRSTLTENGRHRDSITDLYRITPPTQKSDSGLIVEYTELYKAKMTEFEQNVTDLPKETRKLIAIGVIEDRCKERLRNLGHSDEVIQDFINHKLMPKINLL
ncbi:hypothetical protein LOD99_2963 [Oopsacas minuta]|uniref:Uncharacterized protein n=1 Tax=Oopsacas minuta TaxID=111878 RepID=A0AAV7JYZ3_9METZ|nr:hypothetical protein LOD99_2963 [Oopsacas minuta]